MSITLPVAQRRDNRLVWIAPTSPAAALLRAVGRIRPREDLPIVLCIDVEPDSRTPAGAEAGPWIGFEVFAERAPKLRSRLEAVTGRPANFTWFLRMDPQVEQFWGSASWVHDAYGRALNGFAAEGDDLGLHTHTWRWDDTGGAWVADFADDEWGRHCVASGLDAFETAFGRPCDAHRGGDGFLSPGAVAALSERGIPVDVTVEPGRPPDPLPPGERHRGPLPDHRGAPSRPFRSSPLRFPAEDRSNGNRPLFIPHLTSPALIHRRAVHASSRNFAARLAAGLVAAPPVVAIAVRTDTARTFWRTITANLEHLARHRGARFISVSSAAEHFAGRATRG
jgi:hypothetical protein